MDRGYNDYQLFADWTENQIFFVTRLEDNADYTLVEQRNVPANRNILADELIRFNGYYAQKRCPHTLRKVVLWDKDQSLQIELFLKALKQNLKVKAFVGTTENALFIQIWTALIVMLLINSLSFKAKFGWPL